MRIAVLIPDRRDRPLFMLNCIRMMEAQTLKPVHIEIINDEPLSEDCDITYRYRIGYEKLRGKGFDLIALIENDDWYSPKYLEEMSNAWIQHGRPSLFGTCYTIYYHIKHFSYFVWEHHSRSSAMSTFIKPDLDFKWCADKEPYTDMWLWNYVPGVRTVFKPLTHLCIGMKHGVGKLGGFCHVDKEERFAFKDPDKLFLLNNLDKESFTFYSEYFK